MKLKEKSKKTAKDEEINGQESQFIFLVSIFWSLPCSVRRGQRKLSKR